MKNLLAYAYLMTNFDNGARSPLQVLERVVIRSLMNLSEQQTALQVRGAVEKDWGITVPIKVIRYTLGRLSGRQLVERRSGGTSTDDTFTPRIPSEEKSIVKEHERAARQKYERFRKKVTATLFRDGMSERMTADEVIEDWLDKSSLSFLGSGGASRYNEGEALTVNRIIAKTLGVAGLEDEEAVSDLADLALGDALYRSLREITEFELDPDETSSSVSTAAARERDIQIYLDIGVVSRALGYYGDEQKVAVDEMFKMARESGYSLYMFEHTLDELQHAISAAASHLHMTGAVFHGPMIKYALKMGMTPADLLLQSKTLPNRVRGLNIEVVPTPPHDIPLTLDERELDHRIEIGVQQENPRARERDIDSLTSVFRLRGGEPKETLDSCVAIFVTHNKSLQDVAHRFFKDHFKKESSKNVVQLCMTDAVFSSRLWTKLPTTVDWRPRNQVIAFALSNLAPAKGVRDSFLSRLRDLVDKERLNPETALYVEFSAFTNELLALEYRLGDVIDEAEAEVVVRRVIEKAKDDLRTAHATGLEAGIARTEAHYEKIVGELKHGGNVFTQDTLQQIDSLRSDIASGKAELLAMRKVSAKVAKAVMNLVLYFVCFGATAGIISSTGLIKGTLALSAISGLSALVLLWMTWLGLSHTSLSGSVEAWIERKLIRWAGS